LIEPIKSTGWLAITRRTARLWTFRKDKTLKITSLRVSTFLSILFSLTCGLLLFPAAGRDDTYITYWAAYSLSKFGQILNYNMHHIEQSSSFAQVILIALFSRLLNLNVILVGRLTAILFGVGSILVVNVLSRKTVPDKLHLFPLLLATNPFFIYWSFGGLESSLAAFGWLVFVIFETLYLVENKNIYLVVSGLIVLFTRPENPLIVILFSLALVAVFLIQFFFIDLKSGTSKQQLYRSIHLSLINGCMVVLAGALKISMFGDIFSQPVRAKTSGLSLAASVEGFQYLTATLFSPSMVGITLTFVAGCALYGYSFFWKKYNNPFLLNSILLIGIYFVFIIYSGGDWMEGGRFVTHVIPLMCIFSGFALSKIGSKPYFYVTLLLLFTFQMVGLVQFTNMQSTAIPIWRTISIPNTDTTNYFWFEKHNAIALRDMPTISALDTIIQKTILAKKAPVIIMSGQMGMVAFYSAQKYGAQVYWIDRKGLIDKTFTSCSVSNQWEREATGRMNFSYYTIMNNLKELQGKCAVPTPDIIFDLDYSMNQVEKLGFQVVYTQTGSITAGININFSNQVSAGQFIAVNEKYSTLVDELGLVKRRIDIP
jgi:hypothetical protein